MATITLTDMQYGHLGVSSKAMPGDYAMAVPLYSLYGHLRHFHPISLRNPGYSMEGHYTMCLNVVLSTQKGSVHQSLEEQSLPDRNGCEGCDKHKSSSQSATAFMDSVIVGNSNGASGT